MKQPPPLPLRPYRIASIEPLKLTDPEDRRLAAGRAGWNVSCLDPRWIDVDLRTDSAAASRLTSQLASLHATLAPDDPRSHAALVEEIRSLTGMRHAVLFAQGRAAEAALADELPLEGMAAVTNCLFPSSRFHLERRGCEVIECPNQGLSGPASEEPFQGNPDLKAVQASLAGTRRKSLLWLELASNGAFGQPVSLGCLDRLEALVHDLGVRIYLDATRAVENAVLLQRREPRAASMGIREIVRETLHTAHAVSASCLKSFHAEVGGFVATDDEDLARALEDIAMARGEGLTTAAREILRQGIALASTGPFALDRARQAALLHALLQERGLPVYSPEAAHAVFLDARRFLPHLPPDRCPAKSLALALYLQSGIRVDEHFLPEALRKQGLAVVRIALPARRYFDDQIQWVADEIAILHSRRDEVPGLEPLPSPPGLAASLRTCFQFAAQGVNA